MRAIDTTHLDMEAFNYDLDDVVARAHRVGVVGWVIAGASPRDWPRVLETAERTGGAAVLGIHPWWASCEDEALADAMHRLEGALTEHGLGELGLDEPRAKNEHAWARQHEVFEAQLKLAVSRDLPVVLHCVRSLARGSPRHWRRVGLPRRGGMIHDWTGPAACKASTSRRLKPIVRPVCLTESTRRRVARRRPTEPLARRDRLPGPTDR